MNRMFISMTMMTLVASLSLAEAPPIALWAFPYGRDVSGTAHLGVVAYQQSGVTQVVFQVSGGTPVTVTSETINPETGEMEFVLALNTAGYADGTKTISATVSGGGASITLPDRTVRVANSTPNKIYYVAANGDDSASGTSDNPFATIGKAVSVASGGDEVRLMNGDYHLGISASRALTGFVLIRPADGAKPRITSSDALGSGWLHFKGLAFDWRNTPSNLPDNGVNGQIIGGWGKPHLWFEGCTFQGPSGKYNSYLLAIKLWGSVTDLTVERCGFHDINVALAMPPGSLARGNHIYSITSDAFDFNSDTLITGNRVHGIEAPRLFIETPNAGPFNVSGLGLTFAYSEFDKGYTNFNFPDLGALAANSAEVSADDLVQALMADSAFSNKLFATGSNGHLRVTARRSNYPQKLYVTGPANQSLGFKYDSANNPAAGSGQHADVFQTWGKSQSNVIIRNNRAYEVDAQGLLPQTHLSNLAFINNLLNTFGGSWVMNFEKFNYRNILIVHNTVWGRGNSLILQMTNAPVDFTVANNIFGPRGAGGDKVMPGLSMDYNLYDFCAPASGAAGAAHSLWTNPGKSKPSTTPIFANVTSFYSTAISGYEYTAPDGDFSLDSSSPARDKGSPAFGIKYDLNWNPRDTAPDIGCYE